LMVTVTFFIAAAGAVAIVARQPEVGAFLLFTAAALAVVEILARIPGARARRAARRRNHAHPR